MTPLEVVTEIKQLTRDDKLTVYRMLMNEACVKDIAGNRDSMTRRVFSPRVTPEDIRSLRRLLREDRAKHG